MILKQPGYFKRAREVKQDGTRYNRGSSNSDTIFHRARRIHQATVAMIVHVVIVKHVREGVPVGRCLQSHDDHVIGVSVSTFLTRLRSREKIGTGSFYDGFHLQFESAVGHHSVTIREDKSVGNVVAKFMTSAGIVPSGGTAEQFGALLDREREGFAALIKSLGVKGE